MRRRTFLSTLGVGAVAALAGCVGDGDDSDEESGSGSDESSGSEATDSSDESSDSDMTDEGTATEDDPATLAVSTYSAFLDAPSTSPGEWVKSEFESEYDATLKWKSPEREVNHYIERRKQGVDIDADAYLGLSTDELVRVDGELDDSLFADAGEVAGAGDIRPGLDFDPEGRVLPFNSSYICPVYDSTAIEAPETFDGLLDDEYSGTLIAQNPGTSTTGRAFLLHTIHQYGADGYLDYWSKLQDNDVQILGSWSDAYSAWEDGEAPMVVSFSTDQVFAKGDGADLAEHQIRFLNDQAYANPEGMAVFAGADEPELARTFMEFILAPDIQGEIAERNVVFPSTETANLPKDYDELAYEPPEPVTFSYDELQGSISEWIENWEREFINN